MIPWSVALGNCPILLSMVSQRIPGSETTAAEWALIFGAEIDVRSAVVFSEIQWLVLITSTLGIYIPLDR